MILATLLPTPPPHKCQSIYKGSRESSSHDKAALFRHREEHHSKSLFVCLLCAWILLNWKR
ncbi:hypothetical protein BC943DRAFT_322074 [Umbelopsis sp. AD052]|nr:hypothetical protein BC943DRAFT_322074 [Umbelopsis sp. AD052]